MRRPARRPHAARLAVFHDPAFQAVSRAHIEPLCQALQRQPVGAAAGHEAQDPVGRVDEECAARSPAEDFWVVIRTACSRMAPGSTMEASSRAEIDEQAQLLALGVRLGKEGSVLQSQRCLVRQQLQVVEFVVGEVPRLMEGEVHHAEDLVADLRGRPTIAPPHFQSRYRGS